MEKRSRRNRLVAIKQAEHQRMIDSSRRTSLKLNLCIALLISNFAGIVFIALKIL